MIVLTPTHNFLRSGSPQTNKALVIRDEVKSSHLRNRSRGLGEPCANREGYYWCRYTPGIYCTQRACRSYSGDVAGDHVFEGEPLRDGTTRNSPDSVGV